MSENALYDGISTDNTYGFIEYQVPFCEPFLCSTADSTSHNSYFSEVILWNCMPESCRKNLVVFVAVASSLSVFTTVFNLVVLAANLMPSTRRIIRRNPTMQNYSNYVISLSIADLLMGSIVIPLSAIFFHKEAFSPRSAFQLDKRALESIGSNLSLQVDNIYAVDINRLQDDNLTQVAQNPSPGSRISESSALRNLLGFFIHTSILVSVYTLAAASVDRFYVSTKAARNRGIRLSRSSLRRMSVDQDCGFLSWLAMDTSRSTIIVIVIWVLGMLFSFFPLGMFPESYFRQIGHVFVAVSFSGSYTASIIWYIVALALPLAVTWIFSFLLCFVLWRRKKKLTKSCRAFPRQELRERKPADRDVDSSFALVSRYSNTITDTHIVPARSSSSSADNNNTTALQNETYPEVFSDDRSSVTPRQQVPVTSKRQIAPPASLPCSRKRRPSSLDSSLITCKVIDEEEKRVTIRVEGENQRHYEKFFLKCHSLDDALPAGYVAKRILFRRSWDCPSMDPELFQQRSIPNISPQSLKRSESNAASKPSKVTPPTSPIPSFTRKCDPAQCARTPPVRARRRSSIFRAKEFIMSNSFESNIARTLVTVIVVFTLAILPLLVVLALVTPGTEASFAQSNRDVTSLVVVITILLSNSLWNCLIYGARMPYFRRAMGQILRTFFRCQGSYLCAKLLRRKLSITNSFRRDSEISKPAWL